MEDWFLVEVSQDGTVSRYIEVMIWDGAYHKEMSEECGPYYYGCPVEWFQLVPCPASSMAEGWRSKTVKLRELEQRERRLRSVVA